MFIIRTLSKYPALQGVLALALWATGATTTCFLARIPVFELLALAFGFTALIVFIVTVKQKAWSNFKVSWQVWATVFLGIICQQFLAVTAFKSCNAAEVDIILYLWPLLAIVFARMILKIHPHKRYYVAGAFGLTAVIVMSATSLHHGVQLGVGHGFALLSAVCWSVYTTLARKYSEINFQVIGTAYAVGAVLSLCTHLHFEQFVMPTKGESVALLQYIVIATCAFNLWTNSMQSKKATLLTVSSYGKPLISIAALCVFDFANPSLSIVVAGALITLAGFIAHGGLVKMFKDYIIVPFHSLLRRVATSLINTTNTAMPYIYRTSVMILSITCAACYCGIAL
jgi:EamA-like transporter family.